jgi:hypothetical protein
MKQILEEMLLNQFDMGNWRTGFVDHYSHMCVAVNENLMELKELSPRGLIEWREPMTKNLCTLRVCTSAASNRKLPVYVQENRMQPWGITQKGLFLEDGNGARFNAVLFSPEINRLVWYFEISACEDMLQQEFFISFTGGILHPEKGHSISQCENGLVCSFNSEVKASKYLTFPQLDHMKPVWAIRSELADRIEPDRENCTYTLCLKPLVICPGESVRFFVQLDYSLAAEDGAGLWNPGGLICLKDIPGLIWERKEWWLDTLMPVTQGKGDIVKKVRSAAGLLRCEYQWGSSTRETGLVANYCSITSWSATAFFWDSVISAPGLFQLDRKLAKDAIAALFLRQREDGCVPTHSYEHAAGSTFYPQAPIAAWALLHMPGLEKEIEFLKYIVPKIDRLHQWFMETQDHDRDGLPEWRFSGCPADNSPLFDMYARPIGKDLGGLWNIYLPPVASVSLSSFLIMDARCLAYFYGMIGETERSSFYSARVADL